MKLHWELSVLSRAVAFKNLSGAAAHIGISQPQLSRILSRLESELGVTLLDRSAKRKSGWLPLAAKIGHSYAQGSRKLEADLQRVVVEAHPKYLRIGGLEGLIPAALVLSEHLLRNTPLTTLELDVYDLDSLEERFFNHDLDLILTSREPGRAKHRHVITLGYQQLEHVGVQGTVQVQSTYEFHTEARKKSGKDSKRFVSNSLEARRSWIKRFGGMGILPSQLGRQRSVGAVSVYLIASDYCFPGVWKSAVSIAGELSKRTA